MNNILARVFIILTVLFFTTSSHSYALNVETHKAFNEYIARNSFNVFSLGTHLKDQLGFKNHEEKKFNTLKIWELIRDGGRYEDIPYWYMPYLRSVNHFHEPLSDTGFSGIWGYNFLTGHSSITWSQLPVGVQFPEPLPGGNYSWHDARNYFYTALTANNKATRDTNYADAFRGVGQLMHLVEDLSVPEHTRDDGHYIFDNYEDWLNGTGDDGQRNVNIFSGTGIISIRNADLQNYNDIIPIFYNESTLGNINPLASVPVANLFDTNQYIIGADPDITRQSNIGLSEYTNANFLSPDSLFTANFPYPDWSNVVEYDEVIDIPSGKKRTYLKKLGYADGGYGESINHLAAGKWFYKYLPSIIKNKGLKLDQRVYSDYARKLIPRAVGYSVGLLDYFFRGNINIVQTSSDKFQILNLTDEDMEGDSTSFKLFYDDINDNRHEVALEFLDDAGNPYTGPVFISAQSKSIFTVHLDLQSTPLVNQKSPGEFMLVFKGRIGNEGAAPYDTNYAIAAQKITPHFLAHVEVNGQWDIYEYDLLGNRVYNVTASLTRGYAYTHGIPNPADANSIVFQTNMSCPENDPEWTVCFRILTRSTGVLEVAEGIRIPWWSNDGQKVYGVDGGYYSLITGTHETGSPWNGIDQYCGYGYFIPPSLSPDESMLAIEANNPLYSPDRIDSIIFTSDGQTLNATDIVDMNTMSLMMTDNLNICNDYLDDELFFDTAPAFHPTENKIVFASDAAGQFDVYYTDFSVRSIQKLSDAAAGDFGYYQPVWSPDGQTILMAGEKQGELSEIYTMPSTGGTPVKVTNEGVNHYAPRWIGYLGQ